MNKDNHQLGPCPCPSCGYVIDVATSLSHPDEGGPVENDLIMCSKCFNWFKYDKDLKMIPLTTEDKGRVDKKLWSEMEAISARLKAAAKTKSN